MSDPRDRPVVVVGAGVTGMTLAVLLAEAGVDVVVLEREDRPGGLARSFRYGPFVFDVGPHRFHTTDPRVDRFIRDVLGERARTITRKSWLHFKGQFYPWPLHPWWVLLRFPPHIMLGALYDLLVGFRKPSPESFKDQIINMYGETLYRHFFEGYSAKFLGVVPELTHSDWARTGVDRAIIDERLKMQNLWQLLWTVLRPGHRPAMEFLYPAGGCEVFVQILAGRLARAGGRILCGRAAEALEVRGRRIERVAAGDRTFSPSLVVWSGTVHSLAAGLGHTPPELGYLSLVCFNLELTEGERFPFQWCYHGAPDVIFSRVSVPANFDPSSTPPGHRSLCVEVTCREQDDLFQEPRSALDRVVWDLKRENLLRVDREILAAHAERIPWAYPVYAWDYPQKLAAFEERVSGIENLVLAGRLGRFWYNNMDHCIAASQDLAREILARLGRGGAREGFEAP